MKKLFSLAVLVVYPSIIVYSQQGTEIIADRAINDGTQRFLASQTGNDKANWSALISGLFSLASTSDAGGITFKPTLWSLIHLGRAFSNDTTVIDSVYRNEWFARNLQFTGSIIPDSKNQFRVVGGSAGLSYTILNNTEVSLDDYTSVERMLYRSDSIQVFIQTHKLSHPAEALAIETFENSQYHDTTSLTQDFKNTLRKSFHIEGPLSVSAFPSDGMSKEIQNRLGRKPLWTISILDQYDFKGSRTSSMAVTTLTTIHPFEINDKPVSFDLSMAYSWAYDTTKALANLDRRTLKIELGKNIQIYNFLEVKPAASYSRVLSALYANEDENKVEASITPRLKINNQFWMPVTIKYDPKHPELFGFISIQFALK